MMFQKLQYARETKCSCDLRSESCIVNSFRKTSSQRNVTNYLWHHCNDAIIALMVVVQY